MVKGAKRSGSGSTEAHTAEPPKRSAIRRVNPALHLPSETLDSPTCTAASLDAVAVEVDSSSGPTAQPLNYGDLCTCGVRPAWHLIDLTAESQCRVSCRCGRRWRAVSGALQYIDRIVGPRPIHNFAPQTLTQKQAAARERGAPAVGQQWMPRRGRGGSGSGSGNGGSGSSQSGSGK